jgi:hypothetical protein
MTVVYARVKFTLSDQPRVALLTDRGWTLINSPGGIDSLLNHICPLGNYPTTEACAIEMAALLRGTVEL